MQRGFLNSFTLRTQFSIEQITTSTLNVLWCAFYSNFIYHATPTTSDGKKKQLFQDEMNILQTLPIIWQKKYLILVLKTFAHFFFFIVIINLVWLLPFINYLSQNKSLRMLSPANL